MELLDEGIELWEHKKLFTRIHNHSSSHSVEFSKEKFMNEFFHTHLCLFLQVVNCEQPEARKCFQWFQRQTECILKCFAALSLLATRYLLLFTSSHYSRVHFLLCILYSIVKLDCEAFQWLRRKCLSIQIVFSMRQISFNFLRDFIKFK